MLENLKHHREIAGTPDSPTSPTRGQRCDGMKLSNLEKETIILWNEAEKTASIYTYNPEFIRHMAGLCQTHPSQVYQSGDNGWGGLSFSLPKRWLKVTLPRIFSPAQWEVLERMNEKKRS